MMMTTEDDNNTQSNEGEDGYASLQQEEAGHTPLTPKVFNFDQKFQAKIVQAMMDDHGWASQFSEVLSIEYFSYNYLKIMAKKYLGYYNSYKEFPSQELFISMMKEQVKQSGVDKVMLGQIVGFLKDVADNKNLNDLPYVKDQALSWCKKQALLQALDKSLTLAENEDGYEKIVDTIQKAVAAGNTNTIGISLADDIEARYSETYRNTVPTGIPEFDHRKILNGGLGAGELGIIVAPSGVGKSHMLVSFGANALLEGKNVVHYTFELNERVTGIRYDSNLLGISSTDCFEHKDEIKDYYENHKDKLGQLVIKYYPTSSITVQTVRSHLHKLSTKGFRPDLILIDYIGIMRSSIRYELPRLEMKKVCEEVRELGGDLQIPIWTALQSNKEGANSEVVDLTNMAESYAQAAVADFVVGLSRPSLQKSTGMATLFIAKNRAGIDGLKYKAFVDTARSRIKILSDEEAAYFDVELERGKQEEIADFMRKKLREMKKE